MDDSLESSEGTVTSNSTKRSVANSLLGEQKTTDLASHLRALRIARDDMVLRGKRLTSLSGRSDSMKILKFRNRYKGKRCVIIGNGPSLNDTNLGLIRNEYTFGLNRIYLMSERLGWATTFHVVVNELVINQCADDLLKIKAPLFSTTPNRQVLGDMPNAVFLDSVGGPRFYKDLLLGVFEGATVTYVAMQLAYYMGFHKVILVGVDHRFAVSGPAHQVVESTGPDASHFDPNYFGKGFKWQLPDYELSELAYGLARETFEQSGRKIIDATVGGALKVFPKMTLENALS